MNELTDNSGAHALDGIDPDAPRIRLSRESWLWCNNAADDVKELRQMSEADVRHYCEPLPGTKFIKR